MDESIYALNAECDAMQDEIARLEAENVELLEQLKYERQTSRSRLESIDLLKVENAKLRELVVALYHIHFGTEEESWDAWEDFCPCGICEERHGGEAPCAYTAKDLADECCEPITKEIVIDRMRELGWTHEL